MTLSKSYVVIREGATTHDSDIEVEWSILRDKASPDEALAEAGYEPAPGDVIYVFEIQETERYEATTVWKRQG